MANTTRLSAMVGKIRIQGAISIYRRPSALIFKTRDAPFGSSSAQRWPACSRSMVGIASSRFWSKLAESPQKRCRSITDRGPPESRNTVSGTVFGTASSICLVWRGTRSAGCGPSLSASIRVADFKRRGAHAARVSLAAARRQHLNRTAAEPIISVPRALAVALPSGGPPDGAGQRRALPESRLRNKKKTAVLTNGGAEFCRKITSALPGKTPANRRGYSGPPLRG